MGLRLDIPSLSLNNVAHVADRIAERRSPHTEHAQDTDVYLYVCTHGARDCRCGTTGVETARALREEIAAHGAAASRLKVAEVAHVGGHVYAANVLIYPTETGSDTLRHRMHRQSSENFSRRRRRAYSQARTFPFQGIHYYESPPPPSSLERAHGCSVSRSDGAF
ncbi:hypothetical protein BDZ89DRAFT_245028 [Hymenopellis radicata]|nr:hypothetical protein BDZ89DRAFT_245028 [Hymenopellis radicata]